MNAKKLAPLDNKIAEMERRGLLEGLDGAEILLNHHARLAECRRGRGRYVLSSLAKIRGPASKSFMRVPNALKIEATCTPVAPPPTTSIDCGTEVRPQASLPARSS